MRLFVSKILMFFVLLLMLIQPVQAKVQDLRVDDAYVCMQATTKIEKQFQIKKHLLTTIASVETGRYNKAKKQTLSWPWTINAQGKGQFFATKEEAVRAVKKLQAQGVKSIDVGCMQINLAYHGDAFDSVEDALDPETNVAYGAKFLRNLYDQKGDWVKAAMAYHSKVPSKAQRYKRKLASAFEKVKLAHNDFNASLFGNVNKTPSAKAEADRKKLAEQRIAEAKATVAKARENAKAWREAKLEEYRKNRIK